MPHRIRGAEGRGSPGWTGGRTIASAPRTAAEPAGYCRSPLGESGEVDGPGVRGALAAESVQHMLGVATVLGPPPVLEHSVPRVAASGLLTPAEQKGLHDAQRAGDGPCRAADFGGARVYARGLRLHVWSPLR